MWRDLRDLSFSAVGPELGQRAKSIQSDYKTSKVRAAGIQALRWQGSCQDNTQLSCTQSVSSCTVPSPGLGLGKAARMWDLPGLALHRSAVASLNGTHCATEFT